MTTKTIPETPADLARAVLAAIEADPQHFDMSEWFSVPDYGELPPDAEPSCGTVMCAAGWAAHLGGWTLVDSRSLVQVVDRDGYMELTHEYAEMDGERRLIQDVAADALGLGWDEAVVLFHEGRDAAKDMLREIAERPQIAEG